MEKCYGSHFSHLVTVTIALLSPSFSRVRRSRLRPVKTGFWQHSDSDAISNETAYWTLTGWDNEASMQTYTMVDAHREAMPKLV